MAGVELILTTFVQQGSFATSVRSSITGHGTRTDLLDSLQKTGLKLQLTESHLIDCQPRPSAHRVFAPLCTHASMWLTETKAIRLWGINLAQATVYCRSYKTDRLFLKLLVSFYLTKLPRLGLRRLRCVANTRAGNDGRDNVLGFEKRGLLHAIDERRVFIVR